METREFFVAGVQFQKPGLQSCISKMKVGDELELIADPKNKFDPNAVQIWWEEVMIGHVPKTFSAEIAGAISIDIDLKCEVVAISPQAKMWEQCKVKISEVDPNYHVIESNAEEFTSSDDEGSEEDVDAYTPEEEF